MRISMDELTLSEIEEIEDRAGMAFDLLREKSMAKLTRGVAYIADRRANPDKDPDVCWADAGSVTMVQANELLGDDVDPTDAPG